MMGAMTTADSPLWSSITAEDTDIRLIACDMDGTLLDPDGALPPDFGNTVVELRKRGVTFVPASGRQYATLAHMFAPYETEGPLSYIAENGALVMHEGEVASSTTLASATVRAGIGTGRAAWRELDGGLVVCGVRSAYVERADDAFLAEVDTYYTRLEVVDDLTTVDDDVLKLAFFTFEDAERLLDEHLHAFAGTHQVVASGAHWVDLMSRQADKGRALRALQDVLGITPDQTASFGDYLNDAEMLDAATWSFAMADAHPDIAARARYQAPGNHEDGVTTVLRHLLA